MGVLRIISGTVKLCRPTFPMWHLIQPSEAIRPNLQFDPSHHLPFCLLEEVKLESGTKDELKAGMDRSVRSAILAFRLYRPGWFMDPVLSEIIYAAKGELDLGHYTGERHMGAYRLAFYDEDVDSLRGRDLYEIEKSAIARSQDAQTELSRIGNAIANRDRLGGQISIDVALSNFRASYGFMATAAQKGMMLFMALDALLGGMNAKEIGEYKLKVPFRDRLATALSVAGRSNGQSVAKWVDTQCRSIRNGIAHGRSLQVEQAAQAAVPDMQDVIRVLLRQILGFEQQWFRHRDAVLQSIQAKPTLACIAVWNALLERVAQLGGESKEHARFLVSL